VTKYGWGQGEQISWQEEESKRVPDGYTDYRDENSEITSVSVSFKNDPEEDFINRFNKAIDHLQTLYPKKPTRQETF
ncbi:MAG: hypothetical protein RQ756_09600, partial [Flavobacteriaceae bacterium]|nr:hypothetical protein [Flavobacteriaceae bacterium]